MMPFIPAFRRSRYAGINLGVLSYTGIDINYHVNKTFEKRLGKRYKVHPLTERIYQTGCFGRKTGAGYFDYSGDQPVANPKVVKVIQNYLKDNRISLQAGQSD